MARRSVISERRDKVGQMLARSVTSKKEIAVELNLPYKTVENDIQWIKAQTRPWLYGLAGEGYAFDCMMAIDKFLSIESELEDMRQNARKNNLAPEKRMVVMRELRETTLSRLSIEGEGPTLLAVRKIKKEMRDRRGKESKD